MAEVALQEVSKVFPDETRAVDRLSLHAADGELLVIVGPSGCGKSTVLRLVAGLETPTEGAVSIAGTVINEVPPQARGAAMVFQNYALYPHMTVAGNLAFPLKMQRLPKAKVAGKVRETARLLALEPLLERRPAQLSGGERQRVAMGRALVRSPEVFLLDEPLSNLDAALRVEIRGQIADLQRQTGTTCLYVTHDQVEAMTLGHRVAVMRGGKLMQVDTPQALYEQPANTFVAGFIGTPGMNLLAGRLVREQGRPALRVAGMRMRIDDKALGRQPGIATRAEGQVTVGIRPEHLRMAEEGPALSGTVSMVEPLGHEVLAYVDVKAGRIVVVRMSADQSVTVGAQCRVSIDEAFLRLFDPSGQAL